MIRLCYKCKGQRQIMGAGMMFHDCDACLKIGYIDVPEENIESKSDSEAANEVFPEAPIVPISHGKKATKKKADK